MKKTFLSLLSVIVVLLMVGAAVSGCKKEKIEEPEAPQEQTEDFDIKISPRSMNLLLDSTETITVKVSPESLEGVEISYKSSDSDIASVSKKGEVTGNAIGETTITVTATYNGEEVKRKCSVKVFKDTLGIVAKEYTVFVGEEIMLEAKMASGRNVEVEWKSLSTDIAMIDKNGMTQGRASGDAKIVASTTYEKQLLTDTCIVHVTEVIKISNETLELTYIGATKELSCNVSAATWETRDASIVSISGEGAKRTIKGLAEGNTFVVVSYAGKSDSCVVRVGNPPLVITPEGETLEVAKDDTLTLICGYEAKWTIESGSSYIQLLDQDSKTCRVVGMAQGDAVVSASFGEHKDTKNIKVVMSEMKITPVGPISLEATHEQVFTCNKSGVKWEIVSGSDYITLNATSGKVTAKLCEGQAVIKATADGESKTAVINVFMQPMVVTPTSISGQPWVDYFDLECNYYKLYGVEAYFDGTDFMEIENTTANSLRTVNGKCRVHVKKVYAKSTNADITFGYYGYSPNYFEKTAKVNAQITLPAMTATPASVETTYYPGLNISVTTNYRSVYKQTANGSGNLRNVQPAGCMELYNIDAYTVGVRVSKPGTATLRISQFGETVDVPITIK